MIPYPDRPYDRAAYKNYVTANEQAIITALNHTFQPATRRDIKRAAKQYNLAPRNTGYSWNAFDWNDRFNRFLYRMVRDNKLILSVEWNGKRYIHRFETWYDRTAPADNQTAWQWLCDTLGLPRDTKKIAATIKSH